MNRFEELSKSLLIGREKYLKCQKDCQRFASCLVKGLNDYFCLPEGNMKFYPAIGKVDKDQTYTIGKAMDLDEDGLWHFRIMITLYEKPNIFPHQPILINIGLNKENDHYIVGFTDDKKFRITMDKKEEFEAFYAQLFNFLKDILCNPSKEGQTTSMFFLPQIKE